MSTGQTGQTSRSPLPPIAPEKRSRGVRIARIARWIAVAVLALALLLGLFATWLLRSGGGRDFALARVLSLLPPEALSWRSVDGTLAGPLVVQGLRYTHAGLEVEIERVELDLAVLALSARLLHIEALSLERGRVLLPPAETAPQPWPRRIELPAQWPEWRLPLDIRLDALALRDLRIEQGGESRAELQQLDAAGRFERGRVALDKLEIQSDRGRLNAHGTLDTAQAWETSLQSRIDLPLDAGETLPLRLEASGDGQNLRLTARAELTPAATMQLHLLGGLPEPRWQLQLDVPQFDPGRAGGDGEPLSLALRGEGDLAHATLQGEFTQGSRRLQLQPSTLRLDDGVVQVESVAVALAPGQVQVRGSIDLGADAPVLAVDLAASELEFGGADGEVPLRVEATARIDGPLTDYAASGSAQLQRGEERAELNLEGQGSEAGLAFDRLSLVSPHGRLDAAGRVDWSPQLQWKFDASLKAFDPSWIAPAFPGAVDARLTSEGRLGDGGVSGVLQLDPLGGQLREQALGGRVRVEFGADGSGAGEAVLRLGGSRVEAGGRWGDTLDLHATLQPLRLDDVLPTARGHLQGRIALSGARAAPDVALHLEGTELEYEGTVLRRLGLEAQIERGTQGRIALDASGMARGDQVLGGVSLQAEGSRAQHRATLAWQGGPAALDLEVNGGERGGRWRGVLQQLRLTPHDQAPWGLREPAEVAFDRVGSAWRLARACLASTQASLCAQADADAAGAEATLELDALPWSAFDSYLAGLFDAPASAYGTLSGRIRIARDARGALHGDAQVESIEGGLRLDSDATRDWVMYRDLDLRATLDPSRAMVRGAARLGADGELALELDSTDPLAADGLVQGRLSAKLRDLRLVELFGDALVAPRGALDADLAIAGTRRAPRLAGAVELRDFAADIPSAGLSLDEGRVSLRSDGGTAARIDGEVRSGKGQLRFSGRFDADAEERLDLLVRGEDFLAAAIPEAQVTVSPELNLRWRGQQLRLRGEVAVPRARIELERLQSATAPSSDAVIVDAEATEGANSLSLDSDISVVLGEDVRLTGFGLKGKLEGRLGLRDRPGRATVARGGVQVGGEYKAYGQDLRITRGRLSYASTPLDNPALDIRAEREVDAVTVGVQVRGTAFAPQLTLWSEPALEQAEQLSYLVLGRPLRSASQADGAQLSQAAAAFGGNLLAQSLGARMGLDEVGVADSRALGGAALTVGKYLSPRLYLSYGVALFGSGQVVTFKYLLSRVWSVQIDSGTENRAAVNYRLER